LIHSIHGNKLYFRNLFKGASCFFVGSGPSLNTLDLMELNTRGILVASCNNAGAKVRPQLWFCGDEPKNFHSCIWDDPAIWKFVPEEKIGRWYFDKTERGKTYIHQTVPTFMYELNSNFLVSTFFNKTSVSWGRDKDSVDDIGLSGGRSTMLVALKMLNYFGIVNIFLVGCDFFMEYTKDVTQNGLVQQYAWAQYKDQTACKTNNEAFETLNKRLIALRPGFEEHGTTIFNCNKSSGLKAFDHISYEEALATCSAKMPSKVNLARMY